MVPQNTSKDGYILIEQQTILWVKNNKTYILFVYTHFSCVLLLNMNSTDLKVSMETLQDITVYSVELPGVSIRNIDITLERYNTLWYEMYVHVSKKKHYVTCLSSEYIDGVRSSYVNGILRIVIDNPYRDPIHIPILRLAD